MQIQNIEQISTVDLNTYSNRLSMYHDTLVKQRQDIMTIMAQKRLPNYDFNAILNLVTKEIDSLRIVMEEMSNEINNRMTKDIGFKPRLKEISAAFIDFSEQLKNEQAGSNTSFSNNNLQA